MEGKFVVIEGADGAGKSTQVNMLKGYCAENNIDCIFTREPGGTVISEAIRGIILNSEFTNMSNMTELMLYAAARAQHVEELIRPGVKSGKIVFCDRFTASTIAYQGVARGMELDAVNTLNNMACSGLMPDLTIFLDITPEEARSRKDGRTTRDRLEQESNSFHDKVYSGYFQAEKIIGGTFVRIDASGQKHETQKRIIDALKSGRIF